METRDDNRAQANTGSPHRTQVEVAPQARETRSQMVLGKLRMLGAPPEDAEAVHARFDDGSPQTFPQMLEDVRRSYGDKVVFQQKVHRDWQRLSATDLHSRTHDLAAGLIALGLEQGDRVAMVFENSLDWVCSYYAIVVAGGIAVPIYYDLQPAEIGGMVEQADATIAIASAKVLNRVAGELARVKTVIVAGGGSEPRTGVPSGFLRKSQPETLPIEEVAGRATEESRAKLAATIVAPDDLASIVFTSGTTGGMKGVTLTHKNFMANMRSVRMSIAFSERDRIMMVLPMHHVFPFIVAMGVAPAIGGETTLENDLRRTRDRMAEVKPTIFIGVPALFELMYRNIVHGIEAQGRTETFEKGLRIVEATKQRTGINIGRIVFREIHKRLGGSLRFMVNGGAALNPQVAMSFARIGVLVIQGWGLTESAPVLTAQRWNPRKFYMSNYYEEHFGTVGPPVEGVEIGLIDVPEKELYVHLHGEGELVARGDNITPGYWKGEDATKAAKVGEWLRTGDVGRIDDEGNVWITGRSKFVIVLDSGEKVHPDELEIKLQRSPLIEDVVVIGRKLRGKTQTWAIVYPNRDAVLAHLAGEAATEATVRRALGDDIRRNEEDLAPYKRTTDFMLTDIPLPKTALRKVARGQIADSYTFDARRWEQSWAELMAAAAPPEDAEGVEGAAAT